MRKHLERRDTNRLVSFTGEPVPVHRQVMALGEGICMDHNTISPSRYSL